MTACGEPASFRQFDRVTAFPAIAEIQTDGADGPLAASACQDGGRRRSPAKGAIHERDYHRYRHFEACFPAARVDAAGKVVLCRRLRRGQVVAFFAAVPPCLVGMEACGTAHFWAREIAAFGHDVRLMPPGYVKPYVKRNKHDAADAEAVRGCAAAFDALRAGQESTAASGA